MFKSVRRAVVQGVEKTWHTFASYGDGAENLYDTETNRYKKDILIASKDLTAGTDPDIMADAIRRIGHAAWAGGPDAAKCAATLLDVLLGYLFDRETSIIVRTQIVRSLSEIYRGHRDHGELFRSLDVVSFLADILKQYNDSALLRWCCYTLFTICAGSLRNVSLVDAHNLKENFSVLAGLTWKGWPQNYAQTMMLMMGYAREEDFNTEKAEMSVFKKKSLAVPNL